MVHADLHDDRRLTAKGRATRDRIVQVAAELILSDGLSALNMDALRKAASVSGSQLAHYFTDKRALIRAVVARQINVVLDFHRQPKLRALDTFDDFERWISPLFGRLVTPRDAPLPPAPAPVLADRAAE